MSAVNMVDKQISDYLSHLNIVQKKAVLGVIKALAKEEDSYENEMNRRFAELESGAVKGYTWDEAVDHAWLTHKTLKKKK